MATCHTVWLGIAEGFCLQDAVTISDGSKYSWLEFEGVMVKSKALDGWRKYAQIQGIGRAAVWLFQFWSVRVHQGV